MSSWGSTAPGRRRPRCPGLLPRHALRTMIGSKSSAGLFGGGCVGHIAAAIAANPHIRLLGMPGEALQHAQSRAILADHCSRLIGQDTLIGHGLEELAHPKSARVAGRLP